MTQWEVTMKYRVKGGHPHLITAHAEARTGHEAIVAAIEALKEQEPDATLLRADVAPLRAGATSAFDKGGGGRRRERERERAESVV